MFSDGIGRQAMLASVTCRIPQQRGAPKQVIERQSLRPLLPDC